MQGSFHGGGEGVFETTITYLLQSRRFRNLETPVSTARVALVVLVRRSVPTLLVTISDDNIIIRQGKYIAVNLEDDFNLPMREAIKRGTAERTIVAVVSNAALIPRVCASTKKKKKKYRSVEKYST